jgi:hypothetical protein
MRRNKIKNAIAPKRRVLTEKITKYTSLKILEKRERIYSIEVEIHKLVKEFIPEHHSMFDTVGTWECKKSPIGLCYYNNMDDPALDNCLFCHEPHERK